MTLDFLATDILSLSVIGALATALGTAAIAFLTFSKQVDLRPVPVRHTDMRNIRNRRNRR